MDAPTFLTFSLRIDAIDPLDTVKKKIEQALRCTLVGGEFAGAPAFVGECFGIKLGILRWKGIGGTPVYQFHGTPDAKQVRGDPWHEIRIDQAIIDLLRRNGAGDWREPTVEDQMAAGEYDSEKF